MRAKNLLDGIVVWLSKGTLRRQLMMGVVAVHAVLMTLFVLDMVERQRDFLSNQNLAQATSLAHTLATNSTSWILANDVIGLEEVVQSLQQYPDLRYAMVLAPNGRVLAHSDRSNIGLYIEDQTSRSLLSPPFAARTLAANTFLIDVAVPIHAGKRHIGWARIGLDQDSVTANLRVISRNGILYTIAAILIGILFAFLMARHVTHGLERLLTVMQQTRQGRRDVRADLPQQNEIGTVGKGFDAMLDAMSDSEERVRLLLDSTAEGIFGSDLNGSCIFVNPAALKMLGYHSADELLGKNMHAAVHHSHADGRPYPMHECRGLEAVRHGNGVRIDDEVFWKANGQSFPVEYWAYPVMRNGNLIGSVVTFSDITERIKAQNEQRLAAQVFDNSREAIVITDADNRIITVNQAFTKITGYPPAEVQGQNPRILASGEHGSDFYAAMWQSITANGHWQGEIWNRRKSGEIYPEWLSISSVRDIRGNLTHYIAIFADISELKAADERIRFLAQHDALTGLPNRILLQDRLLQAMAIAQRDSEKIAILFIDLDHFKTINDSLGHHVGDRLLQEVAARLSGCVRAIDTVSRQGGDEFVIVLAQIRNPADAAHVAQKILTSVALPYDIDGLELHITPSIGIAVYPDDGRDSESLIKNADAALYHAKENGRNNYQYFTESLNTRAFERLSLENSLRRALERGEFRLHYQPLIDLTSGAIVGVEALIRWQHPDFGLVMPDRFIMVAEDTGLIVPIGEWVIQEACRQNNAWQKAGLPPIRVSVNLSALQFKQRNLDEVIARILAESGVSPGLLELELTESAIMNGTESTVETLRNFKTMGLRLSIDDFGTGYSSLSYLKRFPIDKLKIDRSFVRDVSTDPDDAAIASAIIAMAHSLRLKVIAEGVETKEQLDFLLREGCDGAQGYYYSKPLPAAEMEQFLRVGKVRSR
jgi:diguanylate cyclase (GGDEF)-like protein/PAS domain S-box-containing protein